MSNELRPHRAARSAFPHEMSLDKGSGTITDVAEATACQGDGSTAFISQRAAYE